MNSGNGEMEVNYPKGINITGCSSCGGDHLFLPVRELAEKRLIGTVVYTHYTLCPKTNEIVYIVFGGTAEPLQQSTDHPAPAFAAGGTFTPGSNIIHGGKAFDEAFPNGAILIVNDPKVECSIPGLPVAVTVSEWTASSMDIVIANLIAALDRIAVLEEKMSKMEGGK